MSETPMITTDYLWEFFDHATRMKLLNTARRVLREVEFDAVAFTGVSGALLGPMIADALDKELIVVRKMDREYSHSALRVEGALHVGSYIIADDFVATGQTLYRVYNAIADKATGIRFAGFFGARMEKFGPPESIWGSLKLPSAVRPPKLAEYPKIIIAPKVIDVSAGWAVDWKSPIVTVPVQPTQLFLSNLDGITE